MRAEQLAVVTNMLPMALDCSLMYPTASDSSHGRSNRVGCWTSREADHREQTDLGSVSTL